LLDIGTELVNRFDPCRNNILCCRHYCLLTWNRTSETRH